MYIRISSVLLIILLLNVCPGFAITIKFRDKLPAAKTFFYKRLDHSVSINPYLYIDTFRKCRLKNSNSLQLDTKQEGLYILLADYRVFDVVYINRRDSIINIKDQRYLLTSLKHFLKNYPFNNELPSASIQAMLPELKEMPDLDHDYYESLISDMILWNAINAKDTTMVKQQTARFNNVYMPTFLTEDIVAIAQSDTTGRQGEIVMKYLGKDIWDLFALRQAYINNFWLTNDSLATMQALLNNLAPQLPNLKKDHPALFNLRSKADFTIQLKDQQLKDINLTQQLPGKYTIIYFWGTWCWPCIQVGKELLPGIKAKIKNRPEFQLFTVSSESEERIPEWQSNIKKTKKGYRNLIALSNAAYGWSGAAINKDLQQLGVNVYPNFFIIGPDQSILLKNDPNGGALLKMLDRLLSSK